MGIRHLNNTVEIRLELLKKIGEGLSTRETVKHLQEKFGITASGAYYHFETRNKWLGQYCNFDADYAFQVKQRFNHIYREASFQYQHATEDNARIGYLRTMLEANSKCADYLPAGEGDGANSISVGWKTNSDSLKATLETNNKWRQWVGDNCSPEENKLITDMTRLWIRYEYDTNPELNTGESIH